MGQEGAGPRTPTTPAISTVTGNHRGGGHRGLTPGHRGPRGSSGTGSGNRPDSGRCLFQHTGPLPHAIVPSLMFLEQDRSGRWIKGRRKPGPNWGAGAWGEASGVRGEASGAPGEAYLLKYCHQGYTGSTGGRSASGPAHAPASPPSVGRPSGKFWRAMQGC